MPNGNGSPAGAITIYTYHELEAYLAAFASGHLNLLILIGIGGLGKSRAVRELLGSACFIQGNATPFGMYLGLWKHRNEAIVIDDVDSLYADRSGIRLLKCLCQTEEEKTVAWHSAARSLEKEATPREFVTTSKVVIICNDWRTLNKNVAALQDRGHVLLFEPTAEEVHRKTSEWFHDSEILEYFAQRLHRIHEPSMRMYVRAAELKRAGMDWMKGTPVAPENPRRLLVAQLKADGRFNTEEERVREFIARGGGSRATYFNHARRLAAAG